MPNNTQLSAQAAAFLSTLESGDYPKALVDSYPRVMNAIVDLRHDRVELRTYLDGLLHDNRGGRKGFSIGVLMNIQEMRDRLVGPETDAEGVVRWF